MSASSVKSARRGLKRVLGAEVAADLSKESEDREKLRVELKAKIDRLNLVIGKIGPNDFENTILNRLDGLDFKYEELKEMFVLLTGAYEARCARDLAVAKTFWTRLQWLAKGNPT